MRLNPPPPPKLYFHTHHPNHQIRPLEDAFSGLRSDAFEHAAVDSYRRARALPNVRTCLSCTSNVHLLGNAEAQNGLKSFVAYSRLLWSDEPACGDDECQFRAIRRGVLSIICLDVKGRKLMSADQMNMLRDELERDGVTFVLVVVSAPVVGLSAVESQSLSTSHPAEFIDRFDHEEHGNTQVKLLQVLFEWKGGSSNRDVVIMCGGVGVCVRTEISDAVTGFTIRQWGVGCITAKPRDFLPDCSGVVGGHDVARRLVESANARMSVLDLRHKEKVERDEKEEQKREAELNRRNSHAADTGALEAKEEERRQAWTAETEAMRKERSDGLESADVRCPS